MFLQAGQNKVDIYGITISGGVSLGAYESGFTYYMTNIVDNDNQDIKPNIFTVRALC